MPRRNRKKRVKEAMPPACYAGLVIIGATIALVYVWLGCLCESVGKEIKELETQRDRLVKRLAVEEERWTRTKAPWNVERALAEHGIAMKRPDRSQVVILEVADGFELFEENRYAGTARGAYAVQRRGFGANESLHLANVGRIVMNE